MAMNNRPINILEARIPILKCGERQIEGQVFSMKQESHFHHGGVLHPKILYTIIIKFNPTLECHPYN